MSKTKNIKPKKGVFKADNKWVWIGIIAVLTLIAYIPALKAGLTNWDDPKYIDENPLIMNFSLESLKTVFSRVFMGHYHPLTMISLSIDHFIFSNSPAGYHFTNLMLHIVNSILVFVIFSKLFPDKRLAIISGLLFALHPMHVESVAWISERKDVLFTMFFLFSTYIYLHYSDNKSIKWYLLSFLMFLLACLSKSAAITLPACLLLIDYLKGKSLKDPKIYIDKIPYLLISVVFGILSIYANKPLDADIESVIYRWSDRILYSAYGLVLYLLKLLFPLSLNAWYPYPTGQYFYYFSSVAILVIAFIIYMFLKRYKNDRIVFFSIFFYAINILLVLQVFPARTTVIAERYSYIPSIAFFLLLAYFYIRYYEKNKNKRTTVTAILVVYIVSMMILTFNRSQVWKDSLTLWENVLKKNSEIPVALNNYGLAKSELGLYSEAIKSYDKLLSIKPDYPDGHINRGFAREQLGDTTGALQDYSRAIELDPANILAYSNRAMLWSDLGDSVDAFKDINYALKLQPNESMLLRNLGLIYIAFGKPAQSLIYLDAAISINRNYSLAYENRGYVYHVSGKYSAALDDYNKAIKLSPKSAGTYFNRAATWFKLGKNNNACKDLKIASELGNQQATELYRQYCGAGK
jgi:tetratricopeptide (TPR) repeat protein